MKAGYFTLFLISWSQLKAATIQLEANFEVFVNNAESIFPSATISSGDLATFTLVYSTGLQPNFGDTFEIVGSAILEIGGFSWSATEYELTLSNADPGVPTGILTPTDSLTFRGDLLPNGPALVSFSSVDLFIQSSATDLTLFSSSNLPEDNSDVNLAAVEISSFSVFPPSGEFPGGFISGIGGNSFDVQISIIPEPSSLLLLTSFASTFLYRRNRETNRIEQVGAVNRDNAG